MVSCPSCSAELPSTAISIDIEAARCPSCGGLVDLRTLGVGLLPRRETLPVPIPEGWTVVESASSFSARWRWLRWQGVLLVPFAIFWNGILVAMAFAATEGGKHLERLLIGLVIPHVWIGVGIVYFCLATFLNSTVVEADQSTVAVRIGPMPWRGNRSIPAAGVRQVFVVEKRRKGGPRYDVCAVMSDGRKQVVVSSLDSEDRARYLETRIEAILGIQDQPVAGEVART